MRGKEVEIWADQGEGDEFKGNGPSPTRKTNREGKPIHEREKNEGRKALLNGPRSGLGSSIV